MLDESSDVDGASLSDLTKRLIAQSRSLAENEILRLRLETEKRLELARRATISLAILVPLATLFVAALGAGFILFLAQFVGYMYACFLTAAAYLVVAVPVILGLRRTLPLVVDPTPDTPPLAKDTIAPTGVIASRTHGGST